MTYKPRTRDELVSALKRGDLCDHPQILAEYATGGPGPVADAVARRLCAVLPAILEQAINNAVEEVKPRPEGVPLRGSTCTACDRGPVIVRYSGDLWCPNPACSETQLSSVNLTPEPTR